jgi:subtilisin family serine protease
MGGVHLVRFCSVPIVSTRRLQRSLAVPVGAIALSLVLASTLLADASRQVPAPRADVVGGFASDHVIAKLTPGAIRRMKLVPPQHKVGAAANATERAFSRRTRDVFNAWNVQGLAPVFPTPFRYPELAEKYGLDRYFIFEVPPGSDTPTMAAALRNEIDDFDDVEAAAIGEVAGLFPDDPSFFRQWSMYNPGDPLVGTGDLCSFNINRCEGADISAPEAWDIFTGGDDVTIAIVDSGVSSHSEFGTRLLPGINFANKRCVGGSQPGSNCTSSCPGGGVCMPTFDSSDSCLNGHGTHVAGIAAAAGNNTVVACPTVEDEDRLCGVAGVNWGAKILPVRVLSGCSGSLHDVISGIVWAVDNAPTRDPDGPNGEPGKVRLVINISLQFYLSQDPLNRFAVENAINYAHDAGAVIVSAAGNNQGGIVADPAVLPNSMAISATTPCDLLANFSNYGPQLDMAAPGDQIYSTGRFNGFYCNAGTSMASPHVAGAAALLKSYAPELTNISIRNILTASAYDLGTPGFDQFFGHGRLNLHAAILIADSWPQMLEGVPPSGSIDARRPHPVDDRFAPEGWQQTEVIFRGDTTQLIETDFEVMVSSGPGGAASNVLAIASTDEEDRVRLELEDIIPLGRWTTITHLPSGTSVRIGFLPGDVNGDAATDMSDLEALIDAAEGRGPERPLWSVDMDRSGKLTPADVIELIDMFNGAGDYDPHFGNRIP